MKNAKDNNGLTALMMAVGHPEVVRALIAAKADVNAEADDDTTALKLASIKKHKEVVRLLKLAGAKK